jgi:uracil-DNA glycosylase
VPEAEPATHAPPLLLPPDWMAALGPELVQPYFAELIEFVERERASGVVYPPREAVFAALGATPLAKVRVVLLGQDPYHGPGQAHGLAFSVPRGVPLPPSLRNLFRELVDDLGVPAPAHGCLTSWAEQGVLLLNTVLTVRGGEPGSHRGRGWERFTDAVLRAVLAQDRPVVFLLWGAPAQNKLPLIAEAEKESKGGAPAGRAGTSRRVVLTSAHPSPLSAHRGFFGSRPFSATNAALQRLGTEPIDWSILE